MQGTDASPPVPRQVLLFSGHRVDLPGRVPARFPADKVARAAAVIDAALAALGAGPGDLALTQGSSGADLLFCESCLRRGVPLQLFQPKAEDAFIEESVRASVDGDDWVRRYRKVRDQSAKAPQVLAERDPADTAVADTFERCNDWLLETALAWGPARLRFLCLWDGARSGGPGGTAHLVEAVRGLHLPVIWLDARLL